DEMGVDLGPQRFKLIRERSVDRLPQGHRISNIRSAIANEFDHGSWEISLWNLPEQKDRGSVWSPSSTNHSAQIPARQPSFEIRKTFGIVIVFLRGFVHGTKNGT